MQNDPHAEPKQKRKLILNKETVQRLTSNEPQTGPTGWHGHCCTAEHERTCMPLHDPEHPEHPEHPHHPEHPEHPEHPKHPDHPPPK